MAKVPEEVVKKTTPGGFITSLILMPHERTKKLKSYNGSFEWEIFDIISQLDFNLWKFYKIVAIKESTEETKVRTFTIQAWIKSLFLCFEHDNRIRGKPDEIENTELGIVLHLEDFSAYINNWKII